MSHDDHRFSLDWIENGSDEDPTARLYSSATVNGLPLHFEAIAVGERNEPAPGSMFSDDDLAAIHGAVAGDGYWRTTTIGGREYVIIATPFC